MDPYLPADRAAAFHRAGSRDAAVRILCTLDLSCRICGLPRPEGEAGVRWFNDLPETTMIYIKPAAHLDRPPSSETLAELHRLIRERGCEAGERRVG